MEWRTWRVWTTGLVNVWRAGSWWMLRVMSAFAYLACMVDRYELLKIYVCHDSCKLIFSRVRWAFVDVVHG